MANVTTVAYMFLGASAFFGNAEQFAQPVWTRDELGGELVKLERWKILYKEAKRFNSLVIGEHVRADQAKTDGSAAGVAVKVVAQVLTMPGLAGEITVFLLSLSPVEVEVLQEDFEVDETEDDED